MNTLSRHKQFLINKLGLPYDVAHEIKGYLFYDKKTSYERNHLRKKICEEISSGFNSRNREQYAEEQLNDEYLIVDYGSKCVFSGIYCKGCGQNIWCSHSHRVWCFRCNKEIDSCYIDDENIFHEYRSWRFSTYKKNDAYMYKFGLLIYSDINQE